MPNLIQPQRLSELIGSIYDCTINPEHWGQTLRGIQEAFRSGTAGVALLDRRRDRVLISRYAGLDWRELQEKFSSDVNRMLARFTLEFQPDEPQIISRLPQAYQASLPLIQEGLRPLGFVDVMGYFLRHTSDHFSTFAVARLEEQGVFTEREIALGGLLLPHLRRSVTISGLLDARAVEKARMAETLDALKCGVVLTNRNSGILHANQSAEQMMRHKDPIQSVRGVLQATAPAETRELHSAINLAADDETMLGKMGLAIRVSENSEPLRFAHVLPLARGELRTRLEPEAVAAVFVSASDGQEGAEAEGMAAAFALTPAETRLVNSLLAGRTLVESASALGIATTTAKTHLENVFQKTGVRRQTELFRLAARVVSPVARRRDGPGP